MDNKIDRKIDVTAIQILLVQNRQQTYDLTLIGSGANELSIQEWYVRGVYMCFLLFMMIEYMYVCV